MIGFSIACLLWFSLMPLGAWLAGDPFKEPLRVLPRLERIEPLNHVWPYLMGQAWRSTGKGREAERSFIRALKLNPIDSGVWASLADLYVDRGRKEEAFLALKNAAFLEPLDVTVQWGVLVRLMTLDLPQARDTVQAIVSRLIFLDPTNRRNLFALAQMVAENGEAEALLPHERDVWRSYLLWLITKGKVRKAYDVWNKLGDLGWRDRRLFKKVVSGFLAKKSYPLARKVWLEEFPGDPLVHNGGFERDILDFGFGWRFSSRIPGLKSWGYANREWVEGRRSFFMGFDGESNPYVAWPRQPVYLDTPGSYRLSAYVKTEGVTGASGFSIRVWGRGVRARSKEVKGYSPWKWLKVVFKVREPGLYWVGLFRPSTRKFNKFLGGRVWIDQVRLEKVDEEEVPLGNSG